jgi:hypothetical protein
MSRKEFVGSNDSMPAAPRGYARGFDIEKPRKSGFGEYSGPVYPRSDWKELMNLQEVNQSSPWHHWTAAGCKIKDQKRTSLCWSFGSTGATEARFAQQMGVAPVLSVASVAMPINDFNVDEGGWGEYHFDYVAQHGQATTDTWPELSTDRSLMKNVDVRNDRFQHDVPCFSEFDWKDLDAMVSALLDPNDPTPCTVGFDWMGHLMWAGRATLTDNEITLWIINSWGNWNGNGQVKFVGEEKCRAAEAISICGVKPISKREI